MKLLNDQKFQWVGEGTPLGSKEIKRRGNKVRYEAFCIGGLKIEVGEFVLVRNDDALVPEDVMSCFVAQVKDLFDTGDEFDPFQAQVQWFSRIHELPAYVTRSLEIVDQDWEIVQDNRSSWGDMIDAETIFQKCEVRFLNSDTSCEAVLSEYTNCQVVPVFFCRYVFSGISLIPVNDKTGFINNKFQKFKSTEIKELGVSKSTEDIFQSEEQSDEAESCLRPENITEHDQVANGVNGNDQEVDECFTPKKKRIPKKKKIYCAIPTGSFEYPKVLIKKIDDKVLECNGNVRILVADTNFGCVEDFLSKLKIKDQNCDENLEKKPIIHKLLPQNDTCSEKISTINDEVIAVDSDNGFQIVRTPKSDKTKKKSIPLSDKACKNLFPYNTRNSPKKPGDMNPTPKKKAKVASSVDELSFKHLRRKIIDNSVSEDDIAEKLSNTLKIKKDNEYNVDLDKRLAINSLTAQKNNVEEPKFEMCDYEAQHPMPISRKNSFRKKKASLKNNSHKNVVDNSLESSPNKYVAVEDSNTPSTPKKKAKFTDVVEKFHLTRSGRRVKPVNYAENIMEIVTTATPKKMPRFVRNTYSDDSDSSDFLAECDDNSDNSSELDDGDLLLNKRKTELKKKRGKVSKKNDVQVSSSKKNVVALNIPERKTPLRTPKNALEESRQRLHVSAVPNSLPCRNDEYADIYSFVKGCLCAQTGGCMYISGVPGTGKTATVHEVMRNLEEEKEQGEVPIFTFVEVNGMWMTDPYQCYVQIFKALSGKNIAPQQAADLLEKRFTERGPKKDAVVLLVDELDRLWTRKQTVMYNIFDWPTKKNSKLIVLAIANTMDLPERMMMNRISSRLGLTRKTFQPYTFKQLQEIIMSRIQELNVFDPDAVQLVARKVAAVSGDARRALDICRFATETVKVGQVPKRGQKVCIGMEQVDIALQQMFSSPVISAIRSASKITKLFFQCLLSEFTRSGLEEATLLKVHQQVISTCRFEGFHPPNSTEIFRICADLAASHLILVDNFRNDLYMKIRLNVSSDDVTYALTLK